MYLCTIVLHIAALDFMKRWRYNNRYKDQIVIMPSLCVCESIGAILFISYSIFKRFISLLVANINLCFALIFEVFNNYFIIALLTIDWFLVFYFKFRYKFYISPSKILTLILAFASAWLLVSAIFATLNPLQLISWSQLKNKIYLINLVFDLGYIFLVIGTYSFILKIYIKQKKFRKTTQGTKKEYSFNFLLPALIIVTFILQNVTQSITNITYRYKFKSFSKTVIKLAFISYRIEWLLDRLIYNFFQMKNN